MHDEPRHKLRELILNYGQSLCTDSRRCEALLKDVCGQYRKEIFVLTTALKNRVADELLKNSAGVPSTLLSARLIKRLEDDAAMSSEAAHWAVESWMLALDIIAQPLPRSNTTPTPQIVQSYAAAVATFLLGGRYWDNNDGTVTDVKTGLQWMRFSLGQEWKSGTCVGDAKKHNWKEAKKAAKIFNKNGLFNKNGGYAGYRDWRLPTIDELKSLVYCSSGKPKTWNDTGEPCEGDDAKPTIDSGAFPNTPSSWFWSISPYANSSDYACDVSFVNGYAGSNYRGSALLVRLVRGGK
ncbi:DUF1566 domain-containing protein [Chromatium okenii]|uniref:Lcl C-terminal domain-containing protein n=1 Tax=Chromatium okenii TaxID=61644 RepID=UPI0026EC0BF1|nr:DUF1566 domain-containing protein [Chromatium okenii]MBV5309358.1 DUF1566 domain-containing protein [Chromatium okenii]